MTNKPAKPCPGRGPRYGSCPNLTRGAETCCLECKPLEKAKSRRYDKNRDETQPWRTWIHSTRWRRASNAHKAANPLCAECERQGRITPVYLVHHKIPHEGNYALFWDVNNWESLCDACHEVEHKGERWGK